MAGRVIKITPRGVAGAASAALLLCLTLGTLIAVALRADGFGRFAVHDWVALRFTLTQAVLSAVISVILAVPLARALARRQFRGRALLVTLLGAPFLLPVIVAILGLLAIFGQSGVLNLLLGLMGLPPVSIYGMQGVLLAHVFFNLPLATRVLLAGWQAVPAERFRLAATLGFGPRDVFRQIEWPILKAVVPGVFLVIFLLCLTSFAVALTLGGGPRATTLELAIYQAFRFDFDLGKAALLASVQFGICALAAVASIWVAVPQVAQGGRDRSVMRWDRASWLDWVWIFAAAAFLLAPLASIFVAGLPHMISLPTGVWRGAWTSIWVALGSAALASILALSSALWLVESRLRGVAEGISVLALAASPLVVGTGLFLMIFPFSRPGDWAFVVTAVVNAAVAVPFALRVLLPAVREIEASFGRQADALGLVGFARLRLLILPRLRRPLGFSAGLTAALSMGDLGVVTLFANPDHATLPLTMYRLMAAYRLDQAAGAAVLLLGLSLALFWIFDRGGRVDADV